MRTSTQKGIITHIIKVQPMELNTPYATQIYLPYILILWWFDYRRAGQIAFNVLILLIILSVRRIYGQRFCEKFRT